VLDAFTSAECQQMIVDPHEWRSRGLKHEGINHASYHPILELHSDTLLMRFATFDLRPNDDLSSRYVSHGVRFFEANHFAIKIERGAILIWDNWRMLHARNRFSDRKRHLRRVLIGVSPT
jgi:alpha-ketoglutarate-dependent taurine dioxygenase